jgi:hypothetical protein
MAQRGRGIGTEAGKLMDVKREPVGEGSEERAASARTGRGGVDALLRSGLEPISIGTFCILYPGALS